MRRRPRLVWLAAAALAGCASAPDSSETSQTSAAIMTSDGTCGGERVCPEGQTCNAAGWCAAPGGLEATPCDPARGDADCPEGHTCCTSRRCE